MMDMSGRLSGHDASDYRARFRRLFALVLIAFVVLIVRMAYLQLIRGDEYKMRSENNSVRLRKLKPFRGLIMDSRRRVLADNQPAFDLIYVPSRITDIRQIADAVAGVYAKRGLNLSGDLPPLGKTKPFVPVRLERNISLEKTALVEAHALDLPGVVVEVAPVRRYLGGDVISHVIGYTGEISREELEERESDEIGPGDIIGKAGLEKLLDPYLAGRPGAEQVEVNVTGRVIKSLGSVAPVSGLNAVLTIDFDLQTVAANALEGRAGAVVVLDARDGSVLALVSSPSFDPNLFHGGISQRDWDKLARDPRHPMENRAVSGQYPPGSTYKIVTAAAALSEGLVAPETRFYCNGSFTLGNRSYRCWQRHGHGWVSLHRALVESCDVYFYNLGKALGVDKLAEYARSFGFGVRTGIDLPREKPGLVPTREWKSIKLKEPWQPGENIPISIGQGFDLATPLQLANAYAAVANGGILWRPRLVRQIEEADGRVVKQFPPQQIGVLSLSAPHLEMIRRGLWGVVNEPGGTGGALRRPEGDVAGKTGTAQVVGMPRDERAQRARILSDRFRDHALFACFAPYRQPEIAVAVVVENAGHGGAVAAPVARKIIDAYFQFKRERETPRIAPAAPAAGRDGGKRQPAEGQRETAREDGEGEGEGEDED
ncbi:MAG: penicillin-binding protein 2 [Pseudomonadota bacterium]|nr:penicillin-binding protein 2 [Pseudomonadota bacterium]